MLVVLIMCYNMAMIRYFRDNFRLLALLLPFAILLLGVPPKGTWQCPDGTPCEHDCPMPHGIVATKATAAAKPSCPRCARIETSKNSGSHCSSPQCVLRYSAHKSTASHAPVHSTGVVLGTPESVHSLPCYIAQFTELISTSRLGFLPTSTHFTASSRGPPTLL